MATNRFDEARDRGQRGRGAHLQVSNVLARVFSEIDDFTTAVNSPEAKRRLPLATRLQLRDAALDHRLKAAQLVVEVHEGLPESLPVQTEPGEHELMMKFLEGLGPEAVNAYFRWLRGQLERSRTE